VQHAVDLHRLYRGALQRREKNTAECIAERHSKAALKRLGDDGGERLASLPGEISSLLG